MKLRSRYPQLRDREWLAATYQDYSSRGIAALLGCAHQTVRYALHQHGIELRPVGWPVGLARKHHSVGWPRVVYWQLHDHDYLVTHYENLSQQQLADEIGCCKSAVRQALRRNGIRSRLPNKNMRFEQVPGEQRLGRWA